LREAAMYGLVEWIPQLVQEGADINAADMVGCDVLIHNSLAQHAVLLTTVRTCTSQVMYMYMFVLVWRPITLHIECAFNPSRPVATYIHMYMYDIVLTCSPLLHTRLGSHHCLLPATMDMLRY